MRKKIPLFYQEAKRMFVRICRECEVVLQKNDLDYFWYLLLSWWDNLIFDLMQKFNSCRILVTSHLTLNHERSIIADLQNELNRHCTFEILPGDRLNKEVLNKRNFDLLVVTKSTSLKIEQPILYIDGTAMGERLRLLRQMTNVVVEKNKQTYLAKVKARISQNN